MDGLVIDLEHPGRLRLVARRAAQRFGQHAPLHRHQMLADDLTQRQSVPRRPLSDHPGRRRGADFQIALSDHIARHQRGLPDDVEQLADVTRPLCGAEQVERRG